MMFQLNSMSIKKKVVIGITFAVLASTIIVGVMAQRQAREVLEHRLIDIELPTMLEQISSQIDREVSQLLFSAEQLVNNEFIKQAVQQTELDAVTEAMLVKQLNNVRNQYSLNDASVANRKTAYYWNQNGFLRQLNQQQDGWFFGFTQSGQQTMVSMFQEASGEVKMFANYQNVSGDTMSGLSKSMDDMVNLLNGFKIEDSGFVFLTDAKGSVQIHQRKDKASSSLTQLYGSQASQLLNRGSFNLITATYEGQEVFVASAYVKSMDWFVIGSVPVADVFADLTAVAQKNADHNTDCCSYFHLYGYLLSQQYCQPNQADCSTFYRFR